MKKYVIASGLTEKSERNIENLGVSIIGFHKNKSVAAPVSCHADLSFIYLGDNKIFVAKEMKDISDTFISKGFEVIVNENFLGSKYPQDVPLNCADTGEFLIADIDTVSKYVLEYFKIKGRYIINVKQGYTKCSVVPISKRAIITDDESIYKASKNLLDVLYVAKGYVKLPGYDYGFIGGASGKISDNVIVFNGNIKRHPDFSKISEFLKKYKIEAVSLTDEPLTDIGSIIPLF